MQRKKNIATAAIKIETGLAKLTDDYEEQSNELNFEEEEEEDSLQVVKSDDAFNIGRIDLSFPEYSNEFRNSNKCYPPSYYTLSSKERLLLLFAENFRCQFAANNKTRRPLVLALPNECNVQKFVCTTIRPTAFFHTPLIRNFVECANFVADFIIYEPLKNVTTFPTRLISPSTLLKQRRGNSFEMATLLCSMLIGSGYPAVVVSGVASADIVENNQRNVSYPHEIFKINAEEVKLKKDKTEKGYNLRPTPDLHSHLNDNIKELLKNKAEQEQKIQADIFKAEQELLQPQTIDKYHYRRSHAWVAIIENAAWSIKPKKTYITENGVVTNEPPSAIFIEPCTGLSCQPQNKNYILVDSAWNNFQYYVNKQNYLHVAEIRWDLCNNEDWEHLLPGEPTEARKRAVLSDENIISESFIAEEKHLDTTQSWVSRLHIGKKELEERFPDLQKNIVYKNAELERFSPYFLKDGKIMQITLYANGDTNHEKPTFRWEYYENRSDSLLQIKYDYHESTVEETFAKGRNDSLKLLRSIINSHAPKELYFFSESREDALQYLKYESEKITLHYNKRKDYCVHREFEFKSKDHVLQKITEKFSRNLLQPADNDISVRIFLLTQQKINVQYHFSKGYLTAVSRQFVKPPKPYYGKKVEFDPNLIKSQKAMLSYPEPTCLQMYHILLDQLHHEKKLKALFEKVFEELNEVLDLRNNELSNAKLKFRIFDSLRNEAARSKHLQQYADEETYQNVLKAKPADFLAPYLVPYSCQKLTCEESWAAYNACLSGLRSHFARILNDLQHQYEDLSTESRSYKKYFNKFKNQFSNFDYEQLMSKAKEIGFKKRMVQQRLTLAHENSQKKFESVKDSLNKDTRLNLQKD